MIAAIYARKSTEQNGVADEARSVTRQVEQGRRPRRHRDGGPGDAFKEVSRLTGTFDFVLLDAWEHNYKRLLDLTLPRLDAGGLFLAHNVVNKRDEMGDFLAAIERSAVLLTSIVTPSAKASRLPTSAADAERRASARPTGAVSDSRIPGAIARSPVLVATDGGLLDRRNSSRTD